MSTGKEFAMHQPRPGVQRFSVERSRDGVAFWREVFGRMMFRVDIEPIRDAPFAGDMKLLSLPGLNVLNGISGGVHNRRTRELISDGNDDLFLMVNLKGTI